MEPMERRIRLAPELYVAALEYNGSASAPAGRVLCTHGWLDNAATHKFTAQKLAALGHHVVAFDFPGHGRSDHKPLSSYYTLADYAATIVAVADALAWDTFVLLGHSLGAGAAAVAAGAFPSRVTALILIENLGPSTRAAADAPALFAKAYSLHKVPAASTGSAAFKGSVYPSVEAAVEQRLATVARYEGNQSLSRAAAEALVRRAVDPVTEGGATVGYRFRHDRRAAAHSLVYLHEEQVCAFLSAITCRVLLIRGTRGWPVPPDVMTRRLAAVGAKCTLRELPGSHHLHLDDDTAPAVVAAITAWMRTA